MAPSLGGIFPWSRTARAHGPIKIGLLYPDSGPLAQAGRDMRDGFLLLWHAVGHRAGGREIELLLETKGTNNADEALVKARKLAEANQVHIFAGIISTPVAYVLRAYLLERQVPTMIMNAGADGLTQAHHSAYLFRSSFSNSEANHPLGEWAYAQGYRRAVILAADYRAGHEQIGGFARTFKEAGGKIVQEIYPPVGTSDFGRYLSQIRSDADVVSVFFAGTDALHFVQQYAQSGLKGKLPLVGNGALVDDMILPQQGESALGIVTALHWSSALDTPVNRRFVEDYRLTYQRPASGYSEQGYVGASMLAKALEVVKGRVESHRRFLAALEKIEVEAPRGKVRLDRGHNPVHTIYVCRVERKGGALQNTVIATYPDTSQFWKWSPQAYLAMPAYIDMRGKWVR